MEEVLYRTVKKLKTLSDAEFSELYIAPDSLMDDERRMPMPVLDGNFEAFVTNLGKRC